MVDYQSQMQAGCRCSLGSSLINSTGHAMIKIGIINTITITVIIVSPSWGSPDDGVILVDPR
jgi:hypothetical protein